MSISENKEDGYGKYILIAEDEDINYRYMHAVLQLQHFNVIRATNGLDAIDMALNQNVDMILMDIKMPGLDGKEATRQIRLYKPNIPIIAVTAFALSEDRTKCLDAGLDDYIAKPFAEEDFLAIIRKYI